MLTYQRVWCTAKALVKLEGFTFSSPPLPLQASCWASTAAATRCCRTCKTWATTCHPPSWMSSSSASRWDPRLCCSRLGRHSMRLRLAHQTPCPGGSRTHMHSSACARTCAHTRTLHTTLSLCVSVCLPARLSLHVHLHLPFHPHPFFRARMRTQTRAHRIKLASPFVPPFPPLPPRPWLTARRL